MSGDSNENPAETCRLQDGEEDQRLKNWSLWLEEWKSVGNKLSEKLDVPLESLLMNYGESTRQIVEEKLMLEYVKIPTEFDKYRGKPDFWKLPEALTKKSECPSIEPTYFTVKTKEEQYVVPTIDLVGVPDYINVNEKNILQGARDMYKRWQNCKYRQKQLEKFAGKIEGIVPHRPDYHDLIVLGKSHVKPLVVEGGTEPNSEPTASARQNAVASEASERKEEAEGEDELKSALAPSSYKQRLSVIINDMQLNEDTCDQPTSRTLRMEFQYDLAQKQPLVKYLCLTNNGLATLRMSWKKIKKYRLFQEYHNSEHDVSPFYFDKNEILVLPDHDVTFPIWCKCDLPGFFSESWELETRPRVWGKDFHLILTLYTYAFYGDMMEKVNGILQYIDDQMRNNLIKDILGEIIDVVKYHETPVTPVVYEEWQMFELANWINGRPLYMFDKQIVDKLVEFHEKVNGDADSWNYSIKNLKKLAEVKDVGLFLEQKKNEVVERLNALEAENLDLGRQSSKEVDKSKGKGGKKDKKGNKSGDKKSDGKKSKKSKEVEEEPPPPPPEEIKRENYIYCNQVELSGIVKKLDSPVIINANREKMFSCTQVMSAYFSKMSHRLDSLKEEYNMTLDSKYPEVQYKLTPICDLPDRLVYEYFECDYLSNKKMKIDPAGAKRKPKILRDIPSDDVETIYCTYFNVTLEKKEDEGKGKKKGKKEKGEKKEKKGDKKGKKEKKTPDKTVVEVEESVESFNPYAEEFQYSPHQEEAETEEATEGLSKQPKQVVKDDYKYRQYITVYTCLGEAVDAIVDTIQSFDHLVPHSTLNELKNNFPSSFEEE